MENLEIYLDYIGDDSYVYRYNYDNKKYYNTGICLKGNPGNPGRPGKDGKTPHIGTNGDWYIGDVDTGVKASGDTVDSVVIEAPVNTTDATLPITTLTCEVGKYYRIDVPVETLAVTLPAMTDLTTVKTVVIYLTAGTTPAVTISSADSKDVYYQDGFEIGASKTYEVNALFNGNTWIVASVEIVVPVEEEEEGGE